MVGEIHMFMPRATGLVRYFSCVTLAFALGLVTCNGRAQHATPLRSADALLAIDQNRTTVVDRIVGEWGATLNRSSAGISSAQLHSMLMGLRADHLLAASLAGSSSGLRDVLANSLSSTTAVKSPRLHAMALGDTGDDLVYTPVSPCRLFDTRPAQGGLGVMTPNVRRTYGATTPVANQGGPGGCNAATGAAVALIQIGTLTPSGNGYLQGGAQGVASFPNALILYQPGDQYGTAVAMPLNITNGRFDLQVQFAATDLYGDLLGYFQRPKNYVGTHVITGLAATDSGGDSNTASGDYSTVAGGIGNTASNDSSTVGGGFVNAASGVYATVGGGTNNTASGASATVAGGAQNTASGTYSFAAGHHAVASGVGSFAIADNCCGVTFPVFADNSFGARYTGGFTFASSVDPTTGFFATGCQLFAGGGSWACSSDRDTKTAFDVIDPQSILQNVADMPITRWRFQGEADDVRHIGPMAQDFRAAFGLGHDDKSISMLDAQGVAFAAIQGLNAKVDQQNQLLQTELQTGGQEKNRQLAEQAATIQEQQRQLAELSERLQKAETLAADVVTLKAALSELQRARTSVAAE